MRNSAQALINKIDELLKKYPGMRKGVKDCLIEIRQDVINENANEPVETPIEELKHDSDKGM